MFSNFGYLAADTTRTELITKIPLGLEKLVGAKYTIWEKNALTNLMKTVGYGAFDVESVDNPKNNQLVFTLTVHDPAAAELAISKVRGIYQANPDITSFAVKEAAVKAGQEVWSTLKKGAEELGGGVSGLGLNLLKGLWPVLLIGGVVVGVAIYGAGKARKVITG